MCGLLGLRFNWFLKAVPHHHSYCLRHKPTVSAQRKGASGASSSYGMPVHDRHTHLASEIAVCKNWEKIIFDARMSSPFLPHHPTDGSRQGCAPRRFQDRPTTWRTHSANRHSATVRNRPTQFGQRPVFKDFFLTKRPTADRKSQAPPSVFFIPEGGIVSRLNYVEMKPSGTKPARSELERHGLSVEVAAGIGDLKTVDYAAPIITQRLTEIP